MSATALLFGAAFRWLILGRAEERFQRCPFQIGEDLMQTVDGVTRALNVYKMKTQNKSVDATARSSVVESTSTAPPHHL